MTIPAVGARTRVHERLQSVTMQSDSQLRAAAVARCTVPRDTHRRTPAHHVHLGWTGGVGRGEGYR